MAATAVSIETSFLECGNLAFWCYPGIVSWFKHVCFIAWINIINIYVKRSQQFSNKGPVLRAKGWSTRSYIKPLLVYEDSDVELSVMVNIYSRIIIRSSNISSKYHSKDGVINTLYVYHVKAIMCLAYLVPCMQWSMLYTPCKGNVPKQFCRRIIYHILLIGWNTGRMSLPYTLFTYTNNCLRKIMVSLLTWKE